MGRTTALLLACFILAQADKQVMGLLGPQIQGSFDLSNTQLGFLQGGAFAIAFAIGGMPIARLIDRGHRIRLAAVCVAIWSVATILCGLASSFALLLLFRAATAVAEAALPPAAFSIFSQQKDSRRVARQTGIFMLAPFIGGGLMLMLGGWLLQALASGPVPLLHGWEPWRIVMLSVGLPGLVLAPMLAFLGREPKRAPPAAPAAAAATRYRDVFAHIFIQRPFLRDYYLGMTAFYAATASLLAWYPALLIRAMGMPMGSAGAYAGLTFLIGGVGGTALATAFFASRPGLTSSAIIRVFLRVAMLLCPILLALALAESFLLSVTLYGLFALLSAGVLAMMPVPIQLDLDDRLRGRGVAIMSLMMSAMAGTIGPLFVGILMDVTGCSLATALAAILLLSSAASIWLFARADRARRFDDKSMAIC